MKRFLLILVFLLLAVTAALYLMVPSLVHIRQTAQIKANPRAVNRVLLGFTANENWWIPISDSSLNSSYTDADSLTYSVTGRLTSSLLIRASSRHLQAATALHILPVGIDSVLLEWVSQVPTSYHPIKRWKAWRQSQKLEDEMESRLNQIAAHLSNPEHIYGLTIREERVQDSILVSTYANSKNIPDQAYVYALIRELRQFIAKNGATETGYPMLNTTFTDSAVLTRVAIPVDRRLPSSGKIAHRWMMGGGKILLAEVKGGPYQVQQAFLQMELYVREHNRTPPAIPFFSLVTDRMAQPDSSQWVTRIYYPVM